MLTMKNNTSREISFHKLKIDKVHLYKANIQNNLDGFRQYVNDMQNLNSTILDISIFYTRLVFGHSKILKCGRNNPRKAQWFDKDCLNEKKHICKRRNKFKRSRSQIDRENFIAARSKYTNVKTFHYDIKNYYDSAQLEYG